MANLYQKALEKVWKTYAEDVGKSLIHLGALGWFLSAAAQVTMIAKNNDISKKEKEFLIPQEIADGVINVGLYYTICQGIKKGCESLLENGHFMTQKSFKTIMQMKQSPNSVQDFIKAQSELFRFNGLLKGKKNKGLGNLSSFYKGFINIVENLYDKDKNKASRRYNRIFKEAFGYYLEENNIEKTRVFVNRAFKDYKLFKNGMGIVAAVGASVLSCNIITPITRNITANHFQKKSLDKNKKNLPQVQPKPYVLPVSKTYNGFKI